MVTKIAKKLASHSLSKLRNLKGEVRKNVATAAAAAFAFLIALSWRDAISELVSKLMGQLAIPESTYYKTITALIITVICIVGIWLTSKVAAKEVK